MVDPRIECIAGPISETPECSEEMLQHSISQALDLRPEEAACSLMDIADHYGLTPEALIQRLKIETQACTPTLVRYLQVTERPYLCVIGRGEWNAILEKIAGASELITPVTQAILSPDESDKVPPEAVRKVDSLLAGPLKRLRQWNHGLVRSHRYAHLATFLLQDFRNSREAGQLADLYRRLNSAQRVQLEQDLRVRVPHPVVYNLLFRVGLKPFVFDPREVPGHRVEVTNPEWNKGEPYFTVLNANGHLVFQGVEEGPSRNCEGNFSYVVDDKGQPIVIVNYFQNWQPNFRFYRSEDDFDFFKTYLGNKGRDLWYRVYNEENMRRADWGIVEFNLMPAEVQALRLFFRWDR